jgi:hypothetical protein
VSDLQRPGELRTYVSTETAKSRHREALGSILEELDRAIAMERPDLDPRIQIHRAVQ